jgi:predicted nuclease with TOPRIM domain
LAELQENYQKLSDELTKKSEEVGHLRSENEGLETEVQNLRQRWRSIVLLLQRPKSLQLLSMLVGGEQGAEGSDSGSGIGDLDRYLRCLDALMLPDDKA